MGQAQVQTSSSRLQSYYRSYLDSTLNEEVASLYTIHRATPFRYARQASRDGWCSASQECGRGGSRPPRRVRRGSRALREGESSTRNPNPDCHVILTSASFSY